MLWSSDRISRHGEACTIRFIEIHLHFDRRVRRHISLFFFRLRRADAVIGRPTETHDVPGRADGAVRACSTHDLPAVGIVVDGRVAFDSGYARRSVPCLDDANVTRGFFVGEKYDVAWLGFVFSVNPAIGLFEEVCMIRTIGEFADSVSAPQLGRRTMKQTCRTRAGRSSIPFGIFDFIAIGRVLFNADLRSSDAQQVTRSRHRQLPPGFGRTAPRFRPPYSIPLPCALMP